MIQNPVCRRLPVFEVSSGEKSPLPRFSRKELDQETGFYYYGARYLNPKTSMWISADPAMGDYIPQAPVNDDAERRNGNLPGMGGVFNYVNFHVYHYAGNNPVRYVDPDGEKILGISIFMQQNNPLFFSIKMGDSEDPRAILGTWGCLFTAVSNIANTDLIQNDKTFRLMQDFAPDQKYFTGNADMGAKEISTLLNNMTGRNFTVKRYNDKKWAQSMIESFSRNNSIDAYIIGRVESKGSEGGTHFINILGVDSKGEIIVHDTSKSNRRYEMEDITGCYIILNTANVERERLY